MNKTEITTVESILSPVFKPLWLWTCSLKMHYDLNTDLKKLKPTHPGHRQILLWQGNI